MSNPIATTDYKATSIQGKKRVNGGRFGNPLSGGMFLNFDTELVTYEPDLDRTYINPAGSCSADLTDMTKQIPLRNPADGSLLGTTATLQDALVILFSLGWLSMEEGDVAVLAAQQQQVVE